MFGSTMKLSVDNNHETSSTSSEVYDTNPLEKLNHFRAGVCNLVFSKLVLSFQMKGSPEMDTCVQKLSQLSFISRPQTEMEQFVCLFNFFVQNFCKALFFTMHTVLGNKKIGKTRVCHWVYGFILEQYIVILKSSNSTNKRLNVLILSWHQFKHFLPLLKCLFFFNTGN